MTNSAGSDFDFRTDALFRGTVGENGAITKVSTSLLTVRHAPWTTHQRMNERSASRVCPTQRMGSVLPPDAGPS